MPDWIWANLAKLPPQSLFLVVAGARLDPIHAATAPSIGSRIHLAPAALISWHLAPAALISWARIRGSATLSTSAVVVVIRLHTMGGMARNGVVLV